MIQSKFATLVLTATIVAGGCFSQVLAQQKPIDLPTSKQILPLAPGDPQRVNSLPISMAVSPDRRYVVTVNAGYGTYESRYMQSLSVLDTQTGKLEDFPEDWTLVGAKQTLYSGLAFSPDGSHIYASLGSETDPLGDGTKRMGSGVIVYGFHDGKITREKLLKIGMQQLAPGKKTLLVGGVEGDKAVPFPSAIAVLGEQGKEKLLVAGNLSDDVLLMDASTGEVEKRFDLSENSSVPSVYPIALAVTRDQTRAFVALWNASEVVELDLKNGVVGRKVALLKPTLPTAAGTHPVVLEMAPDERTLYVALSNRDAVAALAIDKDQFKVKGYFDTRLPGQSYFGAEPDALAISPDGKRLYVGNAASDAVAVIDTTKLTPKVASRGMVEPVGFVPTEWMPTAMTLLNGKLYVATAKGKGTGPNNFPQRITEETKARYQKSKFTYIGTLIYGSLASLDVAAMERELPRLTAETLESNRMKAGEEKIRFYDGSNSRIKHVIYIIKENRTYDQIFGDLEQNGKRVGNGDPTLTMYGKEITPNQHALALQFGVLDNFYDSGEVSGDGHVWSTAGIGTDYLERTWQQSYRGSQRTYDFEGVVAEGYPLLQNIPDVNEPSSGYLWGNLARHGMTYYHFGEYISSTFCDVKKSGSSQEGPLLEGLHCAQSSIRPGEKIPAEWGGGENKWPWAIPLLAKNIATKPELVGHFAPEAPDFNLRIPDQIRAEVFLKHFSGWMKDRETGKDTMPNFILLRLGDDHTAGTTPGGPTPKSSVADNDLAIGRVVDAVSHSPYWDDTAFFILEDDAQNGADHVDAHRSLALVISKYAPRAKDESAFVDSRFYSTVSVIRTMETLLGLPPMNNNDAFSSMMSSLFTGPGDQKPFTVNTVNRDNGLIYTANQKTAVGARESMKMDFKHADRADPVKLNVILWKDAMGEKPVPQMLLEKRKKIKKDDDD
ncbi:bifunctional YncE family protein/alkaline phosphatase family protein [Edaphobacter albus]|uniref:bifunctional YncE family protein/alkaline phosphatase family protein n=1 Tax=Edaphobacter sp. 4G125 TaxID=2763071 RepID=UPI0016475A8C|nr:bifunctional YncE family protein/alkaline phosphatase family protein [Edaphobacter sp. 4G125]QNI38130.1 beta-propeller fold lactonase family protein [Edaphobacter sp. 4G125]